MPTRIRRAYFGDGNTPPVEGGKFPALELERLPNSGEVSDDWPADEWRFFGRHVGRPDQDFDELAKEAKILHGVDTKPAKGWKKGGE